MQWFKHDSGASFDAKIKRLLLRYGTDGYAIYFHCLELIAGSVDANHITFELEHDAEIIADNLKVKGTNEESPIQRVEAVMRYIIELGLFTESCGRIFCLKMASRIDKSMVSRSMRNIAIESGNHGSAMAEPGLAMAEPGLAMLDKNRIDKNREEFTHTRARGKESDSLEESLPSSPPDLSFPPDYGRVVYDAIASHPGWKYKPPSLFLGWSAIWARIRPFIAGYHSDDVLYAIKAYGDIRASPEDFWWSADLTVETFFTKHLSRFVPSADPYNALKREAEESEEEKAKRLARECIERGKREKEGS